MSNTQHFRLYPEERHWWSFADYGAVLSVMQRLKAKRVLEFGPGSSTLALIEGGATHIDTCEDNPDWAQVYEERLMGRFPEIVHVHRYVWSDPLTIPAIDDQAYDLALIDGPLGTDRRPEAVRYCLERCISVLAPTEDGNPRLRQFLHAFAKERSVRLEIMETGPLSGGFALLMPGPPEPPIQPTHQVWTAPGGTPFPGRDEEPPDPWREFVPPALANMAVAPSTLTRRTRGRRRKAKGGQ